MRSHATKGEPMSIDLIETLSHTLTDIDLSQAITMLIQERKTRQTNQLAHMKSNMGEGDQVQWYSHRDSKPKFGQVIKVKRKKAIVLENGTFNTRWDVPMGMLKPAGVVKE